jgi:hypothetical protein
MKVALLSPPGTSLFSAPPFESLRAGISEQGHVVISDPTGCHRDVDAVVSLGHQPRRLRLLSLDSLPVSRRTLVILEPRVTCPEMYRSSALRSYSSIYAGSPLWARDVGGESFSWPQVLTPDPVSPGQRFRASMVFSNKRSAVSGSLYGLRRRVLRLSESRGIEIGIAGFGWNGGVAETGSEVGRALVRAMRGGVIPNFVEAGSDPIWKPRHTMGFMPMKRTALETAMISVVIENSLDYVSEKLFDVIRHGVAAVYVGPRLQDFGIPSDVCLQVPPSAEAVLDGVRGLSQGEISRRVQTSLDWLQSSEAQRHEGAHSMLSLGRRIGIGLRRPR